MILRIDRLQTELPPPSDPDPDGAAAVQELLGGKFGEMSTFMNYTFQSFNFRDRQKARPFFDLISNIAGEEFGHIELVTATINTMLTGAVRERQRLDRRRDGGRQGRAQRAAVHRRRRRRAGAGLDGQAVERRLRLLLGRPDRGPDPQLLPRDRRPQQQAARLRDGRPPRGPGADRLSARPRRRAPGRLRARARGPDRRGSDEALPLAQDPDRQDPRVPAAHRARRAPQALPLLPRRLPGDRRRLQGPAPGDRRAARGRRRGARGLRAARPARAARPRSRPTTHPRRSPRSPRSCARRPASPTSPPASSPTAAPGSRTARPTSSTASRRRRPPWPI